MEYIKTIVTNGGPSRDYLQTEYVMNIYRGCNHGCIYCYARSNYYEKTDNFDNIRAKENALQIIRDDLRRKVKPGVVLTGGVSDPYNPHEAEHKLTRNALELLNAFDFGICIITGILIDPVIPFITDTKENVQELVKKAKHHGAKYAYISTLVTLADIQRSYFYQEVDKHFPKMSEKYSKRYKNGYRCYAPHGKKLWEVFVEACEKEGLMYNMRAVNYMIRNA